MKTRLFYCALVAAALSTGVTQGDEKKPEDKSLGEKTSETLQKTGQSISNETKKVGESLKNAVTPESEWRKVDVTLTGKRIEMKREMPPGRTAFVVHNNGSERQNFKVEGEGLDKEFMVGVAPNETKTLNVDLKAGDYKAFVPMPGRKEEPKGNELTLKVK
jgi:hypothetical protein